MRNGFKPYRTTNLQFFVTKQNTPWITFYLYYKYPSMVWPIFFQHHSTGCFIKKGPNKIHQQFSILFNKSYYDKERKFCDIDFFPHFYSMDLNQQEISKARRLRVLFLQRPCTNCRFWINSIRLHMVTVYRISFSWFDCWLCTTHLGKKTTWNLCCAMECQ